MPVSRNERIRRLACLRQFMLHRPEKIHVECANGTAIDLLISGRWMEDGDACYGTAPLAFAINNMVRWSLLDESGSAFDVPFAISQPNAPLHSQLVARIRSTYDDGDD